MMIIADVAKKEMANKGLVSKALALTSSADPTVQAYAAQMMEVLLPMGLCMLYKPL